MIATPEASQLAHTGIEVCPTVIGRPMTARAICRKATRAKTKATSS